MQLQLQISHRIAFGSKSVDANHDGTIPDDASVRLGGGDDWSPNHDTKELLLAVATLSIVHSHAHSCYLFLHQSCSLSSLLRMISMHDPHCQTPSSCEQSIVHCVIYLQL
jgi:hypothetical protein